MRLDVVGTALVVFSLALGCGRGGDPSSVPPLPPPPGGIGTLPDATVQGGTDRRDYSRCADAVRSAWEQFVVECSRSMLKQECMELAAERYKSQKALCESLLPR